MKVKSESEVAQSCPTLSDPMDCSLPGSSVHGIVQARVLEWGAIAFSAITMQDPLNWHIASIVQSHGHSLKFSHNKTVTQAHQIAYSMVKDKNTRLWEYNLIQIWDGFIWFTPGYGQPSNRAPLCWNRETILECSGQTGLETWDGYLGSLVTTLGSLETLARNITNERGDQEYTGYLLMAPSEYMAEISCCSFHQDDLFQINLLLLSC